jgi:hypothetical protein
MKDVVSPAAKAASYIAGPSTNPLEALLKIYECVCPPLTASCCQLVACSCCSCHGVIVVVAVVVVVVVVVYGGGCGCCCRRLPVCGWRATRTCVASGLRLRVCCWALVSRSCRRHSPCARFFSLRLVVLLRCCGRACVRACRNKWENADTTEQQKTVLVFIMDQIRKAMELQTSLNEAVKNKEWERAHVLQQYSANSERSLVSKLTAYYKVRVLCALCVILHAVSACVHVCAEAAAALSGPSLAHYLFRSCFVLCLTPDNGGGVLRASCVPVSLGYTPSSNNPGPRREDPDQRHQRGQPGCRGRRAGYSGS